MVSTIPLLLLAASMASEAALPRDSARSVAASGAAAAPRPVRSAHSSAALLLSNTAAAPGSTLEAALILSPDPGWHAYWRNSGDSGAAPILRWRLPEGVSVGDMRWPFPRRLKTGPLTNFGWEGEAILTVRLTLAPDVKGPLRIGLDAEWLVCQEECLPASAHLSATLLAAARPAANPDWAAVAVRAEGRYPRSGAAWRPESSASARGLTLRLSVPEGRAPPSSAEFFPYEGGVFAAAAPPAALGATLVLELPLAEETEALPARLTGIFVVDGNEAYEVDVPAGPPPAPRLVEALLLAFAGGLLLNLMPCVFPILSLKVLGFVKRAGGSPEAARAHGAAYAAGVMVFLWALAAVFLVLRAQGERLGWGFQLQSPAVVGGLCLLFIVMGAALLGAFELGAGLTRLGGLAGRDGGLWGSFASGGLAVVVATPCTAPFMGAALGAAAAMPPAAALAVFTALGAGLALPYPLLAARPGLLALLPRPGAWMETLKQGLAFPLFGTAAWLAGILARRAQAPRVGTAAWVACAAGLVWWLWSRGGRAWRGAALAAAAAAALLLRPGPPELPWRPFSPAALEEATAGNGAFVDFTADWCVTCQVNERVVLRSPKGRAVLLESGLALLKADWTERDADVTAALAELGRAGVPVYAVYRQGRPPKLLPTVLTPGLLAEGLRKED
ncbi:MAG: thioredoxin family protein [Elusimicrobia bacterium]|nr:thioredoxin family protein [Elusimicrobiota bacterium]